MPIRYPLSLASSLLPLQSWVVVTGTPWPGKLTIFTIWPFYRKTFLTPRWGCPGRTSQLRRLRLGLRPASGALCLASVPGLQAPRRCPSSPLSLFRAFVRPCLLGEGIRTGASRRIILTFWFTWQMDLTGEDPPKLWYSQSCTRVRLAHPRLRQRVCCACKEDPRCRTCRSGADVSIRWLRCALHQASNSRCHLPCLPSPGLASALGFPACVSVCPEHPSAPFLSSNPLILQDQLTYHFCQCWLELGAPLCVPCAHAVKWYPLPPVLPVWPAHHQLSLERRPSFNARPIAGNAADNLIEVS